MGTQFTSRLTKADSKKLLSSIAVVRAAYVRRRQKGAEAVNQLSSAKKRQMAESTVAAVLDVAEQKSFASTLASSDAFVEVLDWLKELRTDAAFKGFQNSIADYELETGRYPLPVTGVIAALNKITQAKKNEKDPFRVNAAAAGKAVLADATIQKLEQRNSESEAHKLGRRIAKLDTKDVVGRYISSFLSDFFERMLSRADPNGTSTNVKDARQLAQEWAQRAARTVASRAENEGRILDSARIRDLMAEELGKHIPKSSQTPANPNTREGTTKV